ncbi:MAG: hypothetical protein PUG84_01500 [Peptoniphilaceae bacterium]|nr:hypothetical protein [Peptoniphilaceae bacterium]
MYYIKGFRGEWKAVSKKKALEYGRNRLKDLGLNIHSNQRNNDIKKLVINKHVRGIDLIEFGIKERRC